MIIKINQDKDIENNIQSIAKEILGKTVYAYWPHLEEIKYIFIFYFLNYLFYKIIFVMFWIF